MQITTELADKILDLDEPGETAGGLTYVTTISGTARRWMVSAMIVLRSDDGAHWGLGYDRGLTEEQPDEHPWRNGSAVDLVRLYPHSVTRVVYRRTPPQ